MQMEAAPPTTGRRNPQQMNWKLAVVCCLSWHWRWWRRLLLLPLFGPGVRLPSRAFPIRVQVKEETAARQGGGDCFCGCDGGVEVTASTRVGILSTNASGHEFDEIQCYRGQEARDSGRTELESGRVARGKLCAVGGGSCNFDFDSAEDTSVGGGCGPAADEPACPVCPSFAQSDACRCDAEDCNNAPDDRCRCPEARAATCCNNGR